MYVIPYKIKSLGATIRYTRPSLSGYCMERILREHEPCFNKKRYENNGADFNDSRSRLTRYIEKRYCC